MGNVALFDCRRCGVRVYEWAGLCVDCHAVVSALGEADRWRSDYSRAERRQMTSRLRRSATNMTSLPQDTRPARRNQPQRFAPLDMGRWDVEEGPADDEWAIEARRRFAQMPQAPAHIQHATGLVGRQTDPICRQGHTKERGKDGRLRCRYCEAERKRAVRAAARMEEAS